MASGRVHIQSFIYVQGRAELLHCDMEAEEQNGRCQIDSWGILLSFQGTEAHFSSLLCCLYPIYEPVLYVGAVYR